MSNVVQIRPNGPEPEGGSQGQASEPVADYHVVPTAGPADKEDLFAYRAAMAAPDPAAEPGTEEDKPKRMQRLVPIALILALAALVVLVIPMVIKPKPPAQYIDMGNRRFDPAGLGGRLIVRWEGSAAYQLYLDPLDQEQVAGFQAVAENPPHPLTVDIRLRDSSGVVTCQKKILFPAPASPTTDVTPAQTLMPRATPSGDTVQNVAGGDGQIAEITLSGGLPCSLKAYKSLASWDFSTNFPDVDGQEDWLRHENGLARGQRTNAAGGRGALLQVQHLATPIEGDDVIVADNPSRGTIETSGGRIFQVGARGLRTRAPEWQIFPAAIHFRCDKNGTCVLTRSNSLSTLQARLMR
jgi:hypothetical protein